MALNDIKWQEWMGYVVHYVKDGEVYIQSLTSYGVTRSTAAKEMKSLVLSGCCAWIARVDPLACEDIPF